LNTPTQTLPTTLNSSHPLPVLTSICRISPMLFPTIKYLETKQTNYPETTTTKQTKLLRDHNKTKFPETTTTTKCSRTQQQIGTIISNATRSSVTDKTQIRLNKKRGTNSTLHHDMSTHIHSYVYIHINTPAIQGDGEGVERMFPMLLAVDWPALSSGVIQPHLGDRWHGKNG